MAGQVRRCQAQARWENSRIRRDHARGQHGSRGIEEHHHRWNTKDSRETAFGPAPALGVLEADMIQWIRDYRELGVKVSEIFVVHKALHVAK